MLNPITDAFAKARVDDVARVAAAHRTDDAWFPPQRATVFSLGDFLGRTLVSLGARFLDERTLVETLEGSATPPPRAA
jgi:hypothetical protein